MSLTREQWLQMWASVKLIEGSANSSEDYPMNNFFKVLHRSQLKNIKREIKKVKVQIESVIGQME